MTPNTHFLRRRVRFLYIETSSAPIDSDEEIKSGVSQRCFATHLLSGWKLFQFGDIYWEKISHTRCALPRNNRQNGGSAAQINKNVHEIFLSHGIPGGRKCRHYYVVLRKSKDRVGRNLWDMQFISNDSFVNSIY